MTDCPIDVPRIVFEGQSLKAARETGFEPDYSSDDYPPDYGGAFDGFTVTSDADPGL